MKSLLKRYPRLFVLVTGCFLSVGMLLFFELSLRAIDHFGWYKHERRFPVSARNPSDLELAKEMSIAMSASVKKYVPNMDPEIAKQVADEGPSVSDREPYDFFHNIYHKHNLTYNLKRFTAKTKTPIYNTTVHFDEFGGRVVPGRSKTASEQFVFIGCSFTFGEGVEDENSYPAYFQKLRPNVQVYNLGMAGNTITSHLFELTYHSEARFKKLKIKNGTMIYLFIDDHLPRVIAPLSTVSGERSWIWQKHFYDWDDQKGAVYKGKHFERRVRQWVYKFFESFYLVGFLGLEYPSMRGDYAIQLFVDMVKKTKELAMTKANIKKFYFVFQPSISSIGSPELDKALREAGIDVLDLRLAESYYMFNKNFELVLDHHPSALGNELTARLLDKKLQSQ